MVSEGADHETTGDTDRTTEPGPATAADPKIAAAVAAAEAAGAAPGTAVRVDSWIWSVRLVKTRSQGATACRGGHVRVNGERVKPAHSLRVGDEVRVRQEGRERIVVVTRLIRKRVGAPVAAQCYVDNSPPPPPREAIAPAGIRDRGTGRPTKRDRRELERLRGLKSFDPLTPPTDFDDTAVFGAPGGTGDPDGRGGAEDRDRAGGRGSAGRQGAAGGRGGAGRRGAAGEQGGASRRGGSGRPGATGGRGGSDRRGDSTGR